MAALAVVAASEMGTWRAPVALAVAVARGRRAAPAALVVAAVRVVPPTTAAPAGSAAVRPRPAAAAAASGPARAAARGWAARSSCRTAACSILAGALTINGNTVTAGAGGAGGTGYANGSSGSAFGSGLFIQGNTTVTFSPATGETETIDDVIGDQTGNGGFGGNAGAGALTKSGAGTLVLAGNNSYTGATTINAGTLRLTGTLKSNVTVNSGATFDGTGTVDGNVTVQSGATLSPGTSPGKLSIRSGGGLTLNSGGTLAMELNGTTAGTDYDQVDIYEGSVTLGGTLSISPGFVPTPGDVFTIIYNRLGSAVTGTFNGLAEGATVTSGNERYTVSYVGNSANDVTLTALKTDQAITFNALADKTYGDAAFGISASSSSGLFVALTSLTTGVCTVTTLDDARPDVAVGRTSGQTVTIVGAGTCTIAANQAGDSTYAAAAQVTQSFTVAKADQTIAFGTLADKTFGDAAFDVSATATSTEAVVFSSLTTSVCTVAQTLTLDPRPGVATGHTSPFPGTVTLVGAGTCTIAADQSGDVNYNAASQVTQSFIVTKADQTITFGTLSGKTYGDAAFNITASSSAGLFITFTSSTTGVCTVLTLDDARPGAVVGRTSGPQATVTIVGAGTCTIAANQSGSSNYNAAPQVTQTFTVAKASQTITFGTLEGKTFGDAAFAITATATSTEVVVFSSLTTGVCTVTQNITADARVDVATGHDSSFPGTVTLVGAGTCTIAADQSGDVNYAAATQVTQSFTVAKASQTITFGTLADRHTAIRRSVCRPRRARA